MREQKKPNDYYEEEVRMKKDVYYIISVLILIMCLIGLSWRDENLLYKRLQEQILLLVSETERLHPLFLATVSNKVVDTLCPLEHFLFANIFYYFFFTENVRERDIQCW